MKTRSVRFSLSVLFTILMLAPTLASAQTADEQTPESFLDTGEFTLAVQAARQLDVNADRDQAFATIAGKQQAAGASQAAIESLAEIVDDTIRAQVAFGKLRQQPVDPGGGFNQARQNGGNGVGGQQGGQSQADFDTLIELITTTVDPDTWEDVGGQGTIAGFPGGVLVDSKGVLKRIESDASSPRALGKTNSNAAITTSDGTVSISLPRLEKALQLRRASGLPPSEDLQSIGGLARIDSIHVFPKTELNVGDIVISGPRARDAEASLRLEDLAVVMRAVMNGDGRFGCSINPRQANLKRTQEYLNESAKRPLRPGERPKWLKQMTELMGRQDIVVFGIPADSSTAQVLVQADYHMKRIGMGLENGPAELRDYFECMEDDSENLPALDVLRWWFNSNFEGIAVNADQTVYELLGEAVKVSSENELLDTMGGRVHTGSSHPVNQQFAAEFTKHFDQLAEQYPVYARMRGIFELAVAAAIIVEDDLTSRVGWQPTLLTHDDGYLSPPINPATEVDSIVGHRVFNQTQIVAGVSGGVSFEPRKVIEQRHSIGKPDYAVQQAHDLARPIQPRGPNEPWRW